MNSLRTNTVKNNKYVLSYCQDGSARSIVVPIDMIDCVQLSQDSDYNMVILKSGEIYKLRSTMLIQFSGNNLVIR